MKTSAFLAKYHFPPSEARFEKFLMTNKREVSMYYSSGLSDYSIKEEYADRMAEAYGKYLDSTSEEKKKMPPINQNEKSQVYVKPGNTQQNEDLSLPIPTETDITEYLSQIAASTQETAKWVKFWSIITIIGFCLAIIIAIALAS